MTESQKQFESWEREKVIALTGTQGWTNHAWAESAWKHQQHRIDELEKKIAIATKALSDIVHTFNEDTEVAWMRSCYYLMSAGENALKQIESTS